MSTAYTDPAKWLAYFLQARTDAVPAAADDASGEDFRVLLDLVTEGVISGLAVSERGAGANMSVDVAVGSAVLEGANTDQGKYAAKIAGTAATNVPIGASDVSNPRIDEVYLVQLDHGYDSSGFVLPRLAVRDGTPASDPDPPGPDPAWDAYLLLATIAVAANEDAIEDTHITDERILARDLLAHAPGEITMFGGATAPDGALLCNGAAASRSTYALLFAEIGEAYGAGDESTTFNLPDLRQRFPLGLAASGTGDALGETGGEIDHDHTVNPPNTTSGNNSASEGVDSTGGGDVNVAAHPHTHDLNIAQFNSGINNPPFQVVNFIIWTGL